MKKQNSLLFPLSLWLPLFFSTPIIVLLKNPDDFKLSFITYGTILFAVTAIMSIVSWLLIKMASAKWQSKFIAVILACATVLALQGYIIHGLFDYGQLDGHKVDWSTKGIIYWTEFSLYLLVIIVLYKILLNTTYSKWKNLSVLLILFSLAQVLILIPNAISHHKSKEVNHTFDNSVFEFSSSKNVIHILADAFQADIVREVFDENPELAQEFDGFTFFENHLGHFQGTAPTVPSIFTGKYFDLDQGFHQESIEKQIEQESYVNELSDAGYRLDFAGISRIYCLDNAHSCVNKSFNDLKSRGYFEHSSTLGDFMWLTDISLFRHVPMFLKEKIYNNGMWMLSAKIARSWSPYPDPVIREWTENMKVATSQPMYKWHHFIGTHIPAQWDGNCQFVGRQPQIRSAYKAQSLCVLKDMAQLFKKMKQLHIYDNSTIIINGDHGCNIPANDLYGTSKNRSTYRDAFLGVVRPVFLFKKPNNHGQLSSNNAPTTLLDIPVTILDIENLPTDKYQGISGFEKKSDGQDTRYFNRYLANTFWTGKPILYNRYKVSGKIRNRLNWQLIDLKNRPIAPSEYDHMSYDSIINFSKGLSLSRKRAKTQTQADVSGSEFSVLLGVNDDSAKQLSLTLSLPKELPKQSVSLWVNQKEITHQKEFEAENYKAVQINMNIPEGTLVKGNNLFTFKFTKTHVLPSNISISSKIHSILLK